MILKWDFEREGGKASPPLLCLPVKTWLLYEKQMCGCFEKLDETGNLVQT